MSETMIVDRRGNEKVERRVDDAEIEADAEQLFHETVEYLERLPISPEMERNMGSRGKPGNPIDPGYFTKS